MEDSNVSWLSRSLTRVLGLDTGEDIANYILSIETKPEVEEYMRELLDVTQPKHKKVLNDLLRRWRPPTRKIAVPDGVQVYKKHDEDEVYIEGKGKKSKKKHQKPAESLSQATEHSDIPTVKPHENGNVPESSLGLGSISQSLTSKPPPPGTAPQTHPPAGGPKKTKFVPLFNEEGESKSVAKLPGRHRCECLATKHALISNCMRCGRIVCEQEGSGPCIFCGQLVCSKEEQEVLNRGSKKSDKLRNNLMSGNAIPRHRLPSCDQDGVQQLQQRGQLPHAAAAMDEGMERAIKHKNKLLEYDRTSVKRTQVIDDESDYFASDSRWLSAKERTALRKREEELRAQKHASRRDRKVTLDFAGREVRESDDSINVYDVNDSVVQAVHYGKGSLDGSQADGANFNANDFTDLVNPTVQPPQFVSSGDSAWGKKKPNQDQDADSSKRKTTRIQDRELQEMSDEGKCMSMHQPWATLLVKGIKIHEGRTWYTPHRGRLWIAATAKVPVAEEIHAIEEQHRLFHRGTKIEFPTEYPTGCLLGCVDVENCLEQDEYREKYPDGESASPYVFICAHPQEMLVKFPIKGKHKIYNLDSRIHQGAKKGLRPS